MTVQINGTSGLVFNDASTQNTSAFFGGLGFRNRIINGAMMIDQRNAGAAVTLNNGFSYTLDRWGADDNTDGAFTVQQSSVAPAGFTNSLLVTTTTADSSLAAGQYAYLLQPIEGFNCADLGFGTSNASTVTLSFWVRSSLTGTFGGALRNYNGTRAYPFSYTISAANTWEQKSVTISGDTTGTWLTNNSGGLAIALSLGVGSTFSASANSWTAGNILSATGATNVIGTLNATWQVTGVQLEKGSTATSFDYRPYGTELALCQRYGYAIEQQTNTGDVCSSASATNVKFTFPVTMRATPTASLITAGSWIVGNGYSANYTAASASISAQQLTPKGGRVQITGFPGFGSNFFVSGTDVSGTAVMFMSSEL